MTQTKPTPRAAFTPEIDRRILEGYVSNRRTMITELGDAGISEAAIVKREEQLGLSTNLRGDTQASGAKLALRSCLYCEQPFASLGPQNRLCKRCRHRA